MKRTPALWLLSLVFVLTALQVASADTYTFVETNVTLVSTTTFGTTAQGEKFCMNQDHNLYSVNKTLNSQITTCRITSDVAGNTILANGTFSGQECVLNATLAVTKGTCYFVVHKEAQPTNYTFNAGGLVPQNFPILNWTKGVVNGAENNNQFATFTGVTFVNVTPPTGNFITVSLFNLVNSSSYPSSVTFFNVTGALTFSYFNITATGFCVTYTGNGTATNCTSGNGASQFFNVTNTTTVGGTENVTAGTYAALLSLQSYRLFLNTSISNFNGTNNQARNQTATGILYLPANVGTGNVKIDVSGNYSKNVSCTVSVALTTTSCNATGIHDNYYAFNATDIWNNVGIQNFTLNISNSTLGGILYTNTTTAGLLNFSLLRGYDYFVQFTVPNATHEYVNVTLAANASNQKYTFQVLPAPSIDITIRDATTGSLILENVTIVLTSNTTGDTVYTVTGGYFATDLTPEQYVVKLSSGNYSQSTYIVTATEGSVYFLTAYLQRNVSDVVMQFVDSIASTVPVSGALITQQTLVNGTWQAISTKLTDITGRTVFGYVEDQAYRFIAMADGYQTKEFTLDPVLFSTYQIKLTRSTALDFDEDFQSVYVGYSPNIFYDAQQNQANITFNSPLGTFTSYAYTLSYPGGTKTASGTNTVGETFTVDFNITGSSYLDRVNISLTYTSEIGTPRSFNYSNGIIIAPGNTTFTANRDNTYGMGLLERLLIGTLVMLIAAGIVTLGAGPLWGLGIGLFIMGLFIRMGFWPWWAAGLSLLLGFALIAGRTD